MLTGGAEEGTEEEEEEGEEGWEEGVEAKERKQEEKKEGNLVDVVDDALWKKDEENWHREANATQAKKIDKYKGKRHKKREEREGMRTSFKSFERSAHFDRRELIDD
jgi:hypothetical protein